MTFVNNMEHGTVSQQLLRF